MKRSLIAGLATALSISMAQAQQAEMTLADAGLQARIEALAGTPGNAFELGAMRSLRAVEKSLQTRYRHGIGRAVAGIPGLRLQLGPQNPRPARAAPDTLTRLMATLLEDLDAARVDLRAAEGDVTPFVLTLQDVWFDVNANGTRDADETALETLAPLLLGRSALRDMGGLSDPIEVRFDEADHAWLTAYTHMLSGAASLFLAFDPSKAIARLEEDQVRMAQAPEIPNTYDQEALSAELEALEAEETRLRAAEEAVFDEIGQMRDDLDALQQAYPRDEDAIDALDMRLRALQADTQQPLRRQQNALRLEKRALRAKLYNEPLDIVGRARPQLDTAWVILAALRQQPDAAHVAAARQHWLQMIAQNRVFWAALAEETDNDREWVPNPDQVSALGIEVPAELAEGWQAILADAQAVLEGRLLMPHPLLPGGLGIDVKSYAADPGPLDLIDWAHGIGATPHVARGPMITRQRWFAFQRLTRGNAGGFALFFN